MGTIHVVLNYLGTPVPKEYVDCLLDGKDHSGDFEYRMIRHVLELPPRNTYRGKYSNGTPRFQAKRATPRSSRTPTSFSSDSWSRSRQRSALTVLANTWLASNCPQRKRRHDENRRQHAVGQYSEFRRRRCLQQWHRQLDRDRRWHAGSEFGGLRRRDLQRQ